MKVFLTKKKIVVSSIILVIVLILSFYVYFSDNAGIVELPGNIIAIDQGTTIAYLIKIPSGYLMIDTGYEKDFDKFLSIIEKKDIKINQIKYLFLTHHHDDHVGYISKMLNAHPELTLIVHENIISLLASGKNNTSNGGGIVNPFIYSLFRFKQLITPDWTLSFPPFIIRQNDIVLTKDNLKFPPEIGLNASVLYTPGHTSDSISLVIDNDYLLCGDLSSNFLNWAGAKHLTLFNENIKNVYISWQNVLVMNIKYILPAHGKPFLADKLKQNMFKYTQENLVKFF